MQTFYLGEIVTLKIHPFITSESEILIAAEDSLVPPLMIIIEIFNDYSSKSEFDEATGIAKGNQTQLKCLYYSHKSHKYETHWFPIAQVKHLTAIETDKELFEVNELSDINKLIGKNVIIKTWHLEIKKKKSSISYATASNDKTKKITGVLSFLPPVMSVIGIKKVDDNKEKIFDKKTGEAKRKFSKLLIKCRWFNPLVSTFSEDFLSPHALEFVPDVNTGLIIELEKWILSKKFIQFNNANIIYNNGNTIGRPLTITFNHCYYILSYYDYLTNAIETIELTEYGVEDFVVKDDYKTKTIPQFSEFRVSVDIRSYLNSEFPLPNKTLTKVYRVNYTNINDVSTTRTIFDAKLIYNGNIRDFRLQKEKFEEKYLSAKCCTREGQERYFKFDRISKIEILDIESLPKLTTIGEHLKDVQKVVKPSAKKPTKKG